VKVAFLISIFPKLSETFVLNQITGLLDAGHEVTVFAQQRPDTETQHAVVSDYDLLDRTVYTGAPASYREALSTAARIVLEHPDATGHVLSSIRRGKAGGERLANLDTLLGLTDFSEYDAAHAHFGPTARSFDFLVFDERFAVGTDVPFVVSFYGYDVSKVLRRDPDAYRDLFPAADAVTALSEDMAEKLSEAGCNPEKIETQQLAIDTEQYRFRRRARDEDDPVTVLTVARFTEKKGIEYAVDAIARLEGNYDLRYRIAGDGPRRERIERRIEQRGLETTVELLGWVDQSTVQQELADADVFLLPSVTASDGDQEGTPTVLLEAQASGLPVVSTYHAGIPEIVIDGESGILVPERDVDSLVGGLETVFENADRWPEMGKRGRQIVETTHSIPAMTDRLERLYREVGPGDE
jgi:colanic acid/amylovoran biosynthesis glycosyltransferase